MLYKTVDVIYIFEVDKNDIIFMTYNSYFIGQMVDQN